MNKKYKENRKFKFGGKILWSARKTYVACEFLRYHLESKNKKDIIKILDNFFNTVANSQINFCWVRTEEKARMLNDF